MSAPTCAGCGRVLKEGESAWAADWTVIAAEGTRTETRYTCDACEPALCAACGLVSKVALVPVSGVRGGHVCEACL